MSKTKKIFLIVGGLFLAFIIILITIALFVASSIFDKNPSVSYTPHVPDIILMSSIMQKINLSGQSILDDNNESPDRSSALFSDKSLEIVLSEKEVNEIIRSGIEYYKNSEAEPHVKEILKNLDIYMNSGVLKAKYSLNTGIPTPFGSYINFDCTIMPELADKNVSVKVLSLKAGKIPVSTHKINLILAEQIRKEKEKQDVRDLLEAVEEVKIEGNNVKIKYKPSAILQMIMKKSGIEPGSLDLLIK